MQPLNHPECANYSTFCWRKNIVTVGLMRCPFSPLRRYLNLFPEPRPQKDLSTFLMFFGQLRKYFQTDNWIETICHILRGRPSWTRRRWNKAGVWVRMDKQQIEVIIIPYQEILYSRLRIKSCISYFPMDLGLTVLCFVFRAPAEVTILAASEYRVSRVLVLITINETLRCARQQNCILKDFWHPDHWTRVHSRSHK